MKEIIKKGGKILFFGLFISSFNYSMDEKKNLDLNKIKLMKLKYETLTKLPIESLSVQDEEFLKTANNPNVLKLFRLIKD